MKFETHKVEKPLSDYIESIFHFEGFQPEHSIERVVPTGHVFIIFELDGLERNTFDSKTLEPNGTYTKVWVSGNHSNHLSISAHQNSEMLVIQLKPNGFYPITHQSVSNLTDRVINAEDLFGTNILELRKQVLDKKAVLDKFNLVEDWLLKRLDITKTPNTELTDVLQQLIIVPFENHSIIISSYPKTQKHLINQFKKYFGLTPKVLHRIYRFNEVLNEIHTKQSVSWSQIAYQFGYTDQSHFIREFNEFSGFNPQEFITSDFHKDETNFFPLDKKG